MKKRINQLVEGDLFTLKEYGIGNNIYKVVSKDVNDKSIECIRVTSFDRDGLIQLSNGNVIFYLCNLSVEDSKKYHVVIQKVKNFLKKIFAK